jgi:hypothetical protein
MLRIEAIALLWTTYRVTVTVELQDKSPMIPGSGDAIMSDQGMQMLYLQVSAHFRQMSSDPWMWRYNLHFSHIFRNISNNSWMCRCNIHLSLYF